MRRRQMVQLNSWDLGHPEFLRGENAAMTDDNVSAIVDHDRRNEAEFADAIRDLANLLLGMLSGMRIENQFLEVAILNVNFDETDIGRSVRNGARCLLGGSVWRVTQWPFMLIQRAS